MNLMTVQQPTSLRKLCQTNSPKEACVGVQCSPGCGIASSRDATIVLGCWWDKYISHPRIIQSYSVLQAADYLEDDLTVSLAASALAEALFCEPTSQPVISQVLPPHQRTIDAQSYVCWESVRQHLQGCSVDISLACALCGFLCTLRDWGHVPGPCSLRCNRLVG